MAAVIPDYEYDIFVSYRHNDDLFEGWVTEFVARLQQELAATVKERLSIYFDRSPVDGLGEMHAVGPSLARKINALILLPLLSQTYCDPTCFPWQQEFLAFKQQASADALGLYLPLPSGNVGCRILPLRIHNLDREDVQLLEQELDGHLRSIDFVYQELGVNRPLRLQDDERATRAGLLFRNQINKVANAIKELILASRLAKAASQPARVAAPALVSPAPPPLPLPAPARPVVFLAWTAPELANRREELALTCAKAGLQVVPTTDCPVQEAEFRRQTQQALAAASCAVHLLGSTLGPVFAAEADYSFAQYAYEQARQLAEGRPGFRQFVWYRPEEDAPVEAAQQRLVGHIRNQLTEWCTFSNAPTVLQFAESLRTALAQPPPAPAPEKDTDIFFVYNQQDTQEANDITDRLSIDLPLELLTIAPDSEEMYKDLAVRTVRRSRLAVVYFKHSADWALPFVKQLWRLAGGASSDTPFLLVGEDVPALNYLRVFKAPKVTSAILAHEVVAQEVRRVYRHLNPAL